MSEATPPPLSGNNPTLDEHGHSHHHDIYPPGTLEAFQAARAHLVELIGDRISDAHPAGQRFYTDAAARIVALVRKALWDAEHAHDGEE